MKKLLSLLLVLVVVFTLVACSAKTSFTVVTTDLEGNETTHKIKTDAATVGEALIEEGLIKGHTTDYGLYVDEVNGIALDWDKDGKYWPSISMVNMPRPVLIPPMWKPVPSTPSSPNNEKEILQMNNYTNLTGREDLLESITILEKELAAKTGKEVALVAYSPVKYAQLSEDAKALAKISELEQLLSKKTGKDVVLVAFSI